MSYFLFPISPRCITDKRRDTNFLLNLFNLLSRPASSDFRISARNSSSIFFIVHFQSSFQIKFSLVLSRKSNCSLRVPRRGSQASHRGKLCWISAGSARSNYFVAIHPRRRADEVFWPLPIKL